jgi:hypothetical protein
MIRSLIALFFPTLPVPVQATAVPDADQRRVTFHDFFTLRNLEFGFGGAFPADKCASGPRASGTRANYNVGLGRSFKFSRQGSPRR